MLLNYSFQNFLHLHDFQFNEPTCITINDTPRKRKLQQMIKTKQSVIERQKKQIKRIQAQNRRLKKKIFKIEDILSDLQHKFLMRNEDVNALKNTNLQVHLFY